jgi:hypothetical protein
MRRAGLTQTRVLEEAERMAGELGLSQLTLAGLAERLGVRQPSLYMSTSTAWTAYSADCRHFARCACRWRGSTARTRSAAPPGRSGPAFVLLPPTTPA